MVWSRKCKQTMDHIIHLIPRILDNGYMAIFHKIKRDYQIPMKQWLIEWRLVWIVLTDLNITDSSLDPSHTHRALTERKSRVMICIDLWWEEINIWLGLSQNTLGIDLSQKTQRHLAPHICRELGGDYQMMERLMRDEDIICVVLTDRNTDKLYYQGSNSQYLLHIFDVWESCKAKPDSGEDISFIIKVMKVALVL